MKKECGFCDEVGGFKNKTALPILSGSCEGWRYSSSLCRAITLMPGTRSSLKFSDWCPLHPSASIKLEGVIQTRCACACFSVNLLQEEISRPESAWLSSEETFCIPKMHLTPFLCLLPLFLTVSLQHKDLRFQSSSPECTANPF